MLLLGQATPHSTVWIVSTEPFLCVTVEPPLFAPGLQHAKAFLWVPPGAEQPDIGLVRRMVALHAHDVDHVAAPTTFDIVQGSPDPAHTPPPWLVCDSPHGVEPAWNGIVHTEEPRAAIEHGPLFSGRNPRPTLQFPPGYPGHLILTGAHMFDQFRRHLAEMGPPPGADAPPAQRRST